jgi:flagellar biosynthetic protein FliP
MRSLRRTLAPRVLVAAAVLLAAGAGAPLCAQEAKDGGEVLRALTGLDGENLAAPLRALAVVTVLGVVPSIVLLTTSFPRIVVVLCFLRRALGTQELPPNMVLFGLSLLLTGVVMTPVWKEVYQQAYVPLVESRTISAEEAYRAAEAPVKRFLLEHTLRADLRLMLEVSRSAAVVEPATTAGAAAGDDRPLGELSLATVLPAFVLSELKTAFQIGFLLFLPFLVIDLVVSAVLVSMGMIMLPPALVSLPLKVLVFVLVDGWSLVVGQLLAGTTT